jgi:hypothetical protein
MLNDHTASSGASMMTSCLDLNGGRKSCLRIVAVSFAGSRERDYIDDQKYRSIIF